MIPRNVQITLVLLLIAILGSGIYILAWRRGTAESLRLALDSHPVAPPVEGKRENVQLTIAYDDDGVFRLRRVSAVLPTEPTARARELLETLIQQYVSRPSPHPLAPGSAVNSVFLVNQKLAVVDLNQAFANEHRSGIMVENFTLVSLIDTLAVNFPQLQQVKLLVDGEERETLAGHADIKTTYSTAAVHKLVSQLQ
ncbi:MAG TPA: GerMN domain-containing protein [Terriglobales bacterium]|nr:GerMN domain-containing protein [Terriglobales bacterium]